MGVERESHDLLCTATAGSERWDRIQWGPSMTDRFLTLPQ
ncbi:uncharacterized protein G2W53_023698 [Senna tora]|uniref:Uncharacterized protein n=1 Tax=Senna tora TaxID=362788 RepID=A0A834T9M8_9FABA|nr:uncharacterized protein G2W53_023698 [Senna tora]